MITGNEKNIEIRNPNQNDFVSRLTFVKGLKSIPELHSNVVREKKKKKVFKNWCMPMQPDGYIKCREHDFL